VSAFRHRNYRLFFSGQLVSLVGTWIQTVAQSWLVYRLTGSALLLGLVSFSAQLPVFLLATVGGAFADRIDRRRVLLTTQSSAMVLALALAALTLSGRVRTEHVFVIAALSGVVAAFDMPARSAFVADMVGRSDLMNAIALNSSMMNGARIVGPAIAGLAVAAVGEGYCFLANGVSFLAVLGSLLAMRDLKHRPPPSSLSTFERIKEGFGFVSRSKPIGALLLLLGVVSLMGMPYAVLMPIIADRVLGVGASGLGVLMACSGDGALAAGLLLAFRKTMTGLGTWVVGSAAAFGAALIVFSFARSPVLAGVALVPVGFFMMIQMSASSTLVQAMTPDALRGRVMALYSTMFLGMAPFGALLAGSLSSRIGPEATVAVGGLACIAGGAFMATRLPKLRPKAREMILALREPTTSLPPARTPA
jgi:MFS family permease